jgi:hypothetical protein
VRVRTRHGSSDRSDDGALLALFNAIASRDRTEITRLLDSSPTLASRPIRIAASRRDGERYFLAPIRHYVYAGTQRCTWLRPRINANSPTHSSRKAPTYASGTEGEPNRFTTPPTAVPTQSTGTRSRSVR